jgi:hypothetical protein
MLSLILIFLSGMCEGVMDTLTFHYKRFEKKHPKAKDKFWNPEYSWLNKYDSQMKPKFIGSTTVFVFVTDGWHLFKWLKNLTLFASFYFIADVSVLGCLSLYAVNRLGFVIIYNWFYK